MSDVEKAWEALRQRLATHDTIVPEWNKLPRFRQELFLQAFQLCAMAVYE